MKTEPLYTLTESQMEELLTQKAISCKKAFYDIPIGYIDNKTEQYRIEAKAILEAPNPDYSIFLQKEEWISVKDQMPEIKQSVLFVAESTNKYWNGRVVPGIYGWDGLFSVPGIGFFASHWMPLNLPLPPKPSNT